MLIAVDDVFHAPMCFGYDKKFHLDLSILLVVANE